MKHPKRTRSSTLSLAISLREWKTRMMFLLLGLFAIFLLMLDRSGNPALSAARGALTDLLVPAVGFLSQPAQTIQSVSEQWQQWKNVAEDNQKLRMANADLKQWQTLTVELQAENASLRKLLKLAPVSAKHYLSGKMLGNLAGSFSQSQFLNLGAEDGVMKDMTVISGEGVVGRVTEVGSSASRVMLITDINSHLAVVAQHSREQAVAFGRNDSLLELRYLPEEMQLKPGELILTSGDAKLIPAGIPVGRVVTVEKNKVLVKPVIDWSRLSYVSLIAE